MRLSIVPNELVEPRNSRHISSTSRVEHRSAALKDYERVYYAISFLRLVGVTQVTTPDAGAPVIHNRMTHSLKVAQLARNIALGLIADADEDKGLERRILELGGLDVDVAAAAGLAHDIGHPPFGHAGEGVLDRLAKKMGIPDGFEGNAQTFRIATKVDGSYGPDAGLNFTAATRAALLKYPWSRPPIGYAKDELLALDETVTAFRTKKFGYYKSEETQYEDAVKWLPDELRDEGPSQTLEASVMDIADDITYAVHDFEDFLMLGLINRETLLDTFHTYSANEAGSVLTRLEEHLARNYSAVFERDRLEAAVEWLEPFIFLGTDLTLRAAAREFRNWLLEEMLNNIGILDEPRGDVRAWIGLDVDAWHRVQLLKFLAEHFVIQRSDLAFMQAGEAAVLKNAVKGLRRWHRRDPGRSPVGLRGAVTWSEQEGHSVERAYLDYICTLGDREVEQISSGLSGFSIPNLWSGPRL